MDYDNDAVICPKDIKQLFSSFNLPLKDSVLEQTQADLDSFSNICYQASLVVDDANYGLIHKVFEPKYLTCAFCFKDLASPIMDGTLVEANLSCALSIKLELLSTLDSSVKCSVIKRPSHSLNLEQVLFDLSSALHLDPNLKNTLVLKEQGYALNRQMEQPTFQAKTKFIISWS